MGTVDVESLMPEIEKTETAPELPEAELNTEAPADKEPQARAEDGKFKGKEPAKKEEAKKEEPPKPEANKTIPIAAYMEDKKSWQQKFEAMEKELTALKNPPKPPEAPPEDPKAYADFRVKAALDQLEGTKKEVEQVKQVAQQGQAQNEQMQFFQGLQMAEADFVRSNPDYYEALEHVRNYRRTQLRLMAPDVQPAEIERYIGQEEIQAAFQLARANRNPIAVVYEMAKGLGYQRKEQQQKVELPNVPGPKQLPPDQTLGSGVTTETEGKDDDAADPFDDAFQQMFGRRKAS